MKCLKLLLNSVNCALLFKYGCFGLTSVIPFSTNGCLDEESVFYETASISADKCVIECNKRPLCKAVNYLRYYRLCSLLKNDDGDLSSSRRPRKPCIFVKKSDIRTDNMQKCQCSDGESCDVESGSCRVTECLKLELENGQVQGNMISIGSRVKYTCDPGYVETNGAMYATCEASGQWSYQPLCLSETTIGSSCLIDSDCSLGNSTCIQYKCFCAPLHRYKANLGLCSRECSSFADTFTARIGTGVNGYNDIGVGQPVSSVEQCKELCRVDPNCASFELWKEWSLGLDPVEKCNRATLTYEMILDADPDSIDGSTATNMYSRDCV